MKPSELLSSLGRRAAGLLERATRPLRGIWPRAAQAAIGLFAFLIVGIALLTSSPTVCRRMSWLFADTGNKYLAAAEGMLNPFRNRSLLLKSDLPIYDLKLNRQAYSRIEQAVAGARKQGWMSDDLKVWAPGTFIHDGRMYEVKVRVRGDLSPHWEGPKKSWRIKFTKQLIEENGQTKRVPVPFQRRREINLIIPRDRDFVVAPFVNALMRDHGLVVPRDRFAVLRINGRLQGLYYEVEHFDKALLAAHERPETAVFGQNDRAMHFEQYTKLGTPATSDARFDIGSMRRQVDDEGQLAMRAMQVLIEHSLDPTPENFRRARAVLDWEKYLRFRNVTTLFNTNHVRFGSDNLKLYFDPSRGKLEPIPWDVHIVKMPPEPGTIDFWNSHGPDELQRSTLLDPELRLQRNRLMWEWVSDGGEELIARFEKMHNRIRPAAWADVLTAPIQGHKMDVIKREFEYNVRRVYKVLNHSSANCNYRLEADDRASVEIVATNFGGVTLRGFRVAIPSVLEGDYRLYEDANDNRALDDGDRLLATTTADEGAVAFALDKHVLPELKYDGDEIDGRHWEYFKTLSGRVRYFIVGRMASPERGPLEWTAPEIEVTAENAVSGREMVSCLVGQQDAPPPHSVGITAYDASDVFDLDAPERSRSEFLREHPQFAATEDVENGVALGGDVLLSGTVIVPRSVPLVLQPGTEVRMSPGASVLCYGGLRAVGTAERPIRVRAAEEGKPWGTFAVVRPPETVVIEHLEVSGGGQAEINGMLFTGGWAVYDGDLELSHSRFHDMHSEDGLNLKNGTIAMQECEFAACASDGVDLDFCRGEVRGCRFIENAGDGLDLSGNHVTILHCRFENNGDKGLSVGEDSHPVVVDALFRGNKIGFSSKDLSVARVAYATFVGNELAVEAKRKKPIFGRGTAEIVNSVFADNRELLREDHFSRGRVALTSSLLDEPVENPGCVSGPVRFVSPSTGDFRLAESSVASVMPELARPGWLQEIQSRLVPSRSEQPGVFGTQ